MRLFGRSVRLLAASLFLLTALYSWKNLRVSSLATKSSGQNDIVFAEASYPHDGGGRPQPKFFIIAPGNVTRDLLDNETAAFRYYENHLNEESAEVWLHRGFERMTYEQGHTMDPMEADVFLVAGYLHYYRQDISRNTQGVDPTPSLIQLYRQQIRDPTKPHLLLVPSWNPEVSRSAGIKPLVSYFQEKMGITNLWSVGFERNLFWQGLPPERILPIPYVVHPEADSRESLREMTTKTRTNNFVFFAGDARKNAKGWAGCHRDKMILPLNGTSNIDVRLVGKHNRISQEDYNRRMITSDYCLILCGDTPSSRSLTSAMVSGCIPIRVGSRLRGLCEPPCKQGFGWKPSGAENPHLPFPEAISWEKFPEVNESEFIRSGKDVLQQVFQAYDQKSKTELRKTLEQLQTIWIYGWNNPVNSTSFGDAVPYIWESFKKMLQDHDESKDGDSN